MKKEINEERVKWSNASLEWNQLVEKLKSRLALAEKAVEAAKELENAREDYAKKAAGPQYGEVWARYMNAFTQLRAALDALKEGK